MTAGAAQNSDRCLICERPLLVVAQCSIDRLVTGDGPFEVLECECCQMGVTRPRLSDKQLEHYYSSGYYETYCEWAEEAPRSPMQRLRSRWRAFSAARRTRRAPFSSVPMVSGRVLDVGCGDGSLLEGFALRGWQAVGLDPSQTAVEAVRRRGLEAHQGTLDDHPWSHASFDAVLFSHSLEHIPDPMPAFEEAARLLAPGGVVAVVLPNWSSWQRKLFGSRWSHLDLPRHQQHFSPTALRRASERAALTPLAIGTESNVISPAYSIHYVLAGRWTEGWKLWMSYGLGALAFPLFTLIDRRRGGDCCYLVAQRQAAGGASSAVGR